MSDAAVTDQAEEETETAEQDEAREILARDDWISTWWAHEKWFMSKPILVFWMAALGMGPGTHLLGDYEVFVDETSCRLANGTLAGSILSLDEALRNLIRFSGCSLEEALPTITTTPARAIGLDHERGRVAPGLVADLVLLSPDLRVRGTIVEGKIVYHNRLDLSSEKGPILR